MTAFGDKLRGYRHTARLTQAELAERAGLSEREISDLERGLTKTPQRATVSLLADALGLPANEAETFQLAARPRTFGQGAPGSGSAGHNLPAALTSFIGREDEIARLRLLLEPESRSRLVTLTGEGGCGKTRLAIQVALDALDHFPGGVYFVDLSALADPKLVPNAVLTAIGGQESAVLTPLESLLRQLKERRMLLVLDNCEHLLMACAELVHRLLVATPQFRILATSREALRVPGEVAWRVRSLSTPRVAGSVDADQLLNFEAVKLFRDRILQANPDFHLAAGNVNAVADVCCRLDGIPLAIELAAACGAAMSVQEIAARLDDCFNLLTGGSRIALRRQRTLRATMDWSHDLLSFTEQALFRRLAVFAGGWTLAAAEVVCAGEPLQRSDILPILMRLIDQSLVSAQIHDDTTRYRFLDTVRSYAADRLRAVGEQLLVQVQHRDWCLDFAERASDGLSTPDGAHWFHLLTLEHENVRTALDTCRSHDAGNDAELRLMAATGQFWFPRRSSEGRRHLVEALERAGTAPSAVRACALTWQAVVDVQFGNGSAARGLASAALVEARDIGDPRRIAEALWVLVLASEVDDVDGRLALLDEGLVTARGAGLDGLAARHLAFLAAAAAEAGDLGRARMLAEESDALARRAGDTWNRMITLTQLGWLAVAEGRLDDAESYFQVLLELGAEWGGYHDMPALIGLGQVHLRRGDLEQARTLHRRLLADLRELSPDSMVLANGLVCMASVDFVAGLDERAQRLVGAHEAWHAARDGAARTWASSIRGPLMWGLIPVPEASSDVRLTRARAEGRAMSIDEAVTYALAMVAPI
jgi:predicted ATPase/DNA-binding XRE family transcriptional regulator